MGADVLGVADGHRIDGVAVDVIQDVEARPHVSLKGEWQYIVDPFDTGAITPWSGPRAPDDPEAFWAPQGARDQTHRIEHRFDDAHTLDVPGDWNSQRPELPYYEGPLWYRRTFDVDHPNDGRRRFLCFGAVANRARVWLNGHDVGAHEGGFTPFDLEITDALRPGENELVVLADNTRRPDTLPALNFDWWNYGGITRDVLLVDLPPTFIRDERVGLSDDGSRIRGWASLDGPDRSAPIRLRIPDLSIDVETTPDAAGVARFDVPVPDNLERWSPAHPRLYDVTLSAGDDSLHDRVGFRTVTTRGPDILLNDHPIFLRGICLHEEAPERAGRAWSEADARLLLGWAKELGCNYVRLAHYPHNEHMLRVADEMGLLVWAEIPVYWRIEFDNPDTLAAAKTMLAEMITRDKNRASVIIWSVGNETGERPEGARFRTTLAHFVKDADPTRLISAALLARLKFEKDTGGESHLARMVVDDPFADDADVLAINEYAGWYYGSVDDIPSVKVVLPADKPLVISEFGAGAKQGFRGDPTEPWSEDLAARIYERQIEWFRSGTIPNLRGVSPWILKDFRSPRRVLYNVQDGYNRKGLISKDGFRKLDFAVLQRYYRQVAAEHPDE